MGASVSWCALGEDSKQKEKNNEINRILHEQRKALENETKLLLLGGSRRHSPSSPLASSDACAWL